MSSGKPDVILRKYRSILFSALAVELTTFIVSLLDPIIAGNRIGIGALSAISLFSPFISFSTFVAAVINTGTLVNYTLDDDFNHSSCQTVVYLISVTPCGG